MEICERMNQSATARAVKWKSSTSQKSWASKHWTSTLFCWSY